MFHNANKKKIYHQTNVLTLKKNIHIIIIFYVKPSVGFNKVSRVIRCNLTMRGLYCYLVFLFDYYCYVSAYFN